MGRQTEPAAIVEVDKAGPPVAKTAAELAQWLLIIFGLVIVIHYAVMAIFLFPCSSPSADRLKQLEFVERIFNSLLPVIAGLLGSAVAYYFSRERGKE
jgi:threonine/homoserine/homoserine lactone efflux protein